ncbi:MAG TPA: RDD family protein [Edaphobacter sp.]|nr:RDD family protein [Edaphobacter sp.]
MALKEQVAERLAAHRARKSRVAGSSVTPISQTGLQSSNPKSRSARIVASVAERYAQSQSYRAFLAEEAERAIRQAEAAAQVAALSAQAVVDAQNQLLFELDQLAAEVPLFGPAQVLPANPEADPATPASSNHAPTLNITEAPRPSLTIRLYEDVGRHLPEPRAISHAIPSHDPFDEAEGEALDEEIAFRQSPVFEPITAPVEIPANLIEFPRQLVAARKARPRLAEGPLREEATLSPTSAQLRIFEVEATQLSTAPVVESVAPEWSSMMLGAQPAPAPFIEVPETRFLPIPAPQAAPLSLRLMATIVDGILVMAAFLGFVATFAFTCRKFSEPLIISLQTAAITSVGTLIFLYLTYQLLFFTFGEATPGMRYGRIALCTLSDENPTRAQIRRRIFATILAACPLGIGFLWACLDDEGLGWHDRISRMYQRSY